MQIVTAYMRSPLKQDSLTTFRRLFLTRVFALPVVLRDRGISIPLYSAATSSQIEGTMVLFRIQVRPSRQRNVLRDLEEFSMQIKSSGPVSLPFLRVEVRSSFQELCVGG